MSDNFNFDGKQSRSGGGPMQIWDMLSIVVLIVTLFLAGYFALIFFNPQSSLNFLRPGARGPKTPTATPTEIQLQATWTPSPTLEMTSTITPRPTFTPFFTNTPFSLVPPTRTPKPTSTPKAPFGAGTPNIVASTLIHPELACNWAGIGGKVVDANNSPIIGMVVVLRGSLDNKLIEQQTVSGINKEYGQSGFEFVIGNAPIASNKTLYIQLVDQSGIPLSDKIFVTTYADCNKNLIIIQLKKR